MKNMTGPVIRADLRKEISFGARIFSLVDTIDALVYDRLPSRTAFSLACEESANVPGAISIPDLVDPALELLADYVNSGVGPTEVT